MNVVSGCRLSILATGESHALGRDRFTRLLDQGEAERVARYIDQVLFGHNDWRANGEMKLSRWLC